MSAGGIAAALAVAAIAALALGVAAAAGGHWAMPWSMGWSGMGSHMGGGMMGSMMQGDSHGGDNGMMGGMRDGMMANNSGGHDEDMEGHCMSMMSEMMQAMHQHGEEHRGGGPEYGMGMARWLDEAETWNGTAKVVWADPALRLLGLQLEDGSNVTVRLAKAYVRASDGSLVYGGWLTSAAQAEGTVWVKIAGHEGRGLVVEIDVGGQAYIIPAAYGRS